MRFHYAVPLFVLILAGLVGLTTTVTPAAAAKPGYEPAYYNGQEVTINAIEVKQNPTDHAWADFYEVVYPNDFASLGIANPQCNPCDHEGNGIDPTDFHDHILDSIPSDPGHGEYNALWHVFVVLPYYPSLGGSHTQAEVNAYYKANLPITSEADVDAAIAGGWAKEVDTGFYFICAVVNGNAAK